MSLDVKESCSCPCSSSVKNCVLLILMSVLLSVFEKGTFTSPISFIPISYCRRNKDNYLHVAAGVRAFFVKCTC